MFSPVQIWVVAKSHVRPGNLSRVRGYLINDAFRGTQVSRAGPALPSCWGTHQGRKRPRSQSCADPEGGRGPPAFRAMRLGLFVTAAFPGKSWLMWPPCPQILPWASKSETPPMEMSWTHADPDGGGFYRETVTGIHNQGKAPCYLLRRGQVQYLAAQCTCLSLKCLWSVTHPVKILSQSVVYVLECWQDRTIRNQA